MHIPRDVAVSVPIYLPPSSSSTASSTASSSSSSSLAIPENTTEPLFLLCSSRKHPERYVLPKGGVDPGESSEQAALREGWEEAGFRGHHLLSLSPPIPDRRPPKPKHASTDCPRAIYYFHLVLVTSLEQEWPESHERTRRWCTRQEVEELTLWREEVKEGLDRVSKDMEELRRIVQDVEKAKER